MIEWFDRFTRGYDLMKMYPWLVILAGIMWYRRDRKNGHV